MNDVDKVIASVIATAHLSISLGHFRSDFKSQIYYNFTTTLITVLKVLSFIAQA